MPISKLRTNYFVPICLLLSILFAMVPFPPAQQKVSKTTQSDQSSAGPAQHRPLRRRPLSAPGSPRNAQISGIVAEINAGNIESTIRRLVSFGTRNTLSDQNDPNRGIGAARDWLYSEFQKAAAQSGGRMTVEKQSLRARC